MKLQARVREQMQAHGIVQPGDRILAAVSGGADSVCLLYILADLRETMGFTLRAAHIHHGLRESADRDRDFTQALCDRLGIPCRTEHVDVRSYAAREGIGTEEAARTLRYRALEEICRDWEEEDKGPRVRIAAAHHMEDQAETVLYRLCRGTGIAGAAGMRMCRDRVIRPLLPFTREEIEQDLAQRGAGWCTDETNEDLRYARNRIRREILPALETVNTGAADHLAAFAREAAGIEDYLARQTGAAITRCLLEEGREPAPADGAVLCLERAGETLVRIRVESLLREDPLLRGRLLHAVLAGACGGGRDLTAAHAENLLRLACREGYGTADLPGGLRAVKTGGWPAFHTPLSPGAYIMRILSGEEREDLLRQAAGAGTALRLPENQYTKWFDYDKISSLPALRTRQTGDRIGIGDGAGGIRFKSLQRCMIDGKIPAPLRDRIVLPAVGREILWLPGCRIHEGFKVTERTEWILELRLPAGEGRPGNGLSAGGQMGEQDERKN